MIFLRMLSPDLQELEALAELLLRKQLAMDINIKKGIERLELQDDRVQKRTINLLTAKTKGLLFNEIQQAIDTFNPNAGIELYALPITHMNWQQTNQMTRSIRPV